MLPWKMFFLIALLPALISGKELIERFNSYEALAKRISQVYN